MVSRQAGKHLRRLRTTSKTKRTFQNKPAEKNKILSENPPNRQIPFPQPITKPIRTPLFNYSIGNPSGSRAYFVLSLEPHLSGIKTEQISYFELPDELPFILIFHSHARILYRSLIYLMPAPPPTHPHSRPSASWLNRQTTPNNINSQANRG